MYTACNVPSLTVTWRRHKAAEFPFEASGRRELIAAPFFARNDPCRAEVERVLPDYRERRAALRQFGRCLRF